MFHENTEKADLMLSIHFEIATSDRSKVVHISQYLFCKMIIVAQILRVVQISENIRYYEF